MSIGGKYWWEIRGAWPARHQVSYFQCTFWKYIGGKYWWKIRELSLSNTNIIQTQYDFQQVVSYGRSVLYKHMDLSQAVREGFKNPRHGNFPLGFLESTVRGGGVDVPPISIKWAKTVVFGEKIPFSETDCPLRGGTLLFR